MPKIKLPGFLVMILTAGILLHPADVKAQVDYFERDYLYDERIRFYGSTPVQGRVYTISQEQNRFPQQITFKMHKDRDLFVTVEPLLKTGAVRMWVSLPHSFYSMRPVWSETDLRNQVRFWTSSFWIPTEECNTTGCPKLRFEALEGTITVTVVEKRPRVLP